ncbi:MAG TPA: beta-propeller fold lactonase family protein, partial [Bryobacteraceae bacterium]
MHSLSTTLAAMFALGVAIAQPYAYTSNISGNSISVVNTANNTVSATISVPASPTGLAVTPDGAYLYVACQGANSVAVINTATNAIVTTIPVGTTP